VFTELIYPHNISIPDPDQTKQIYRRWKDSGFPSDVYPIDLTDPDKTANHICDVLQRYMKYDGIFQCFPGDFTLLSRQSWKKVNAYRNSATFSYLDSVLLIDCDKLGIKQFMLPLNMSVFHQEHSRNNIDQTMNTPTNLEYTPINLSETFGLFPCTIIEDFPVSSTVSDL